MEVVNKIYMGSATPGSGGGGSDPHNLGWYADLAALQAAHATGENGDFAILGSTDTVWVWDSGTSAWKDTDQKGQVASVNGQTGVVSLDINDIAPTQTGKSGYVLGTDGFVAGWVKPEIVQRSALPAASEDEVDNIYQYVGATDANYTNGYFYKCVSDGQNPATYSWVQTDVQPTPSELPSQSGNSGKFLTTDGTNPSWATVGGLPSQTGQSGKFLTTDGTDASWSDKPLVNTADTTPGSQYTAGLVVKYNMVDTNKTGIILTNADNVYGNRAFNMPGVIIGRGAFGGQMSYGVAIGPGAGNTKSSGSDEGGGVCVGTNAHVYGDGVSIGTGAEAGATGAQNTNNNIAIGTNAKCGNSVVGGIILSAAGSVALNSVSNTFMVANKNGAYEIMSADGTIPADRLASTTGLADGNYRPRLTMAGGVPTLSWVAE